MINLIYKNKNKKSNNFLIKNLNLFIYYFLEEHIDLELLSLSLLENIFALI
jgi:hypothetical protein